MSVRTLVCAGCLLWGLVGPAEAEGRKLAVIVGINTYRVNSGLPPLRHAVGDAASLSAALRQQGFTVYELTHDVARQPGNETLAPNIAYIRDQIEGVLGFPNLGRDDAVLITLHGHGVQFEQVERVTRNGVPVEEKTPRFYFCPADATITDVKVANDLTDRNCLLPLDELYAQLGACPAATRLLIVDACRNDPTQPGVFREGLASATLPKLPPPPGGMAAFFSCKANERAVEDPTIAQGVFTHFLVQGLSGQADQPLSGGLPDGIVTFAELASYVANNTYAHVYEKYKVRQSPELRGEFDLNLPLARIVRTLEGSRAGEVREFAGDLKVKFCWCPPGSFTMGSPTGESDRDDDEAQAPVTLTRGYWLGQTEVTQGLWESVLGTAPWVGPGDKDYYRAGANYPAVYVDWNEAREFCEKLTERERRAGRLPAGWSYQLPTEAQWEYACRAGTESAYSFGADAGRLSEYAWFDKNAWNIGQKYAHVVGTKKSNGWNLYDMHGNVWEWCQDMYGTKLPGGRDPLVSSGGSFRVSRGGCWLSTAWNCRSAYRNRSVPSYRYRHLGFRLALSSSGD